jgi:hypothetical protein
MQEFDFHSSRCCMPLTITDVTKSKAFLAARRDEPVELVAGRARALLFPARGDGGDDENQRGRPRRAAGRIGRMAAGALGAVDMAGWQIAVHTAAF